MDQLIQSFPILVNVASRFLPALPKTHCFFRWKEEFSFSSDIFPSGKTSECPLKLLEAKDVVIDEIPGGDDIFQVCATYGAGVDECK